MIYFSCSVSSQNYILNKWNYNIEYKLALVYKLLCNEKVFISEILRFSKEVKFLNFPNCKTYFDIRQAYFSYQILYSAFLKFYIGPEI